MQRLKNLPATGHHVCHACPPFQDAALIYTAHGQLVHMVSEDSDRRQLCSVMRAQRSSVPSFAGPFLIGSAVHDTQMPRVGPHYVLQ